MSHNPYSESETRCRVFQRASNILRDVSFCDTPQIFPNSWEDLQSIFNTLPRDTPNRRLVDLNVTDFSEKLNSFIQNNNEIDLRITQINVNNLKQKIQAGLLTMPEEFQ